MKQNNIQNSAKNKSLNESNISSLSSAVEMDQKDEEIRKLKAKLQQIEEANSKQFGGLSMKQMGWQFGEKFDELKKEIGKLSNENTALKEKMDEMDKKNAELETKVADLTGRIDGMELIQLKNIKWNAADCGPKLDISEGGLAVKHSGSDGWNCIRAISPIPPFNLNATNSSIAGYFEAQIVKKKWSNSIHIGFCTQQFPLEDKWLGNEKNSIGIYNKGGIWFDGQFKEFGNNADKDFNVGNVIGVGIIHFPENKSMKCFATCNGQSLVTLKLPDKFSNLQLFPAATLEIFHDSIRANFGQETWKFDASQLLK